jgi:7-cyano-7-deazaguanine synthase
LGVERKVIKLEWDKPYKIIPKNRGVEEIRSNVSVAFLEGRNIVFLALACAEAAGLNAKEIWMGVNALDFFGYPDCSPEFIDSFQNMLYCGYPGGPKIVTSLISVCL